MRRAHRSTISRGFTLIELMITLLIVSVGMLGLAKLQAAAIAESSVSRTRSLMTFQAESLSGMMQSNRGYWAVTTGTLPNFSVGTVATPVTDNAGTLDTTTTDCTTSSCTPARVAGLDVKAWANDLLKQFPTASGGVVCTNASVLPTTLLPTTCDITLRWAEHYVAINKTATDAAASTGTSSMVLHVQP